VIHRSRYRLENPQYAAKSLSERPHLPALLFMCDILGPYSDWRNERGWEETSADLMGTYIFITEQLFMPPEQSMLADARELTAVVTFLCYYWFNSTPAPANHGKSSSSSSSRSDNGKKPRPQHGAFSSEMLDRVLYQPESSQQTLFERLLDLNDKKNLMPKFYEKMGDIVRSLNSAAESIVKMVEDPDTTFESASALNWPSGWSEVCSTASQS
jgi:hypothetical protein